ncbi:B- and T-lymphocyte attenuator isoform X1 [Trachemys scripta elegans]|uniref:B- and T-lymphocyte attenuator isoform X1 n=1 Tax=Trachemys scripta elegans TaxID=31138 RepID=UPI001555A85B|nr:B- and T-lymphocyte attenuator isoform X1 [Trachemys scripta elegans]
MTASPGMQANRIVLHILLVVLSLDVCQVYGDVTVNCTVELHVTRGKQYQGKPGDFLSIECPVEYCTEKPAMNWCKIEEKGCLLLKDESNMHTAWKQEKVFVLNFVPVHQNNSGFYRCQATVGSLNSQSHAVVVHVQEVTTNAPTNPPSKEFAGATNVTEAPQGPSNNNKKWIIYALPSLGALCLLILICLCLLCCLQWHQVKPKTTPVTSQKEMNTVSRSTCAPYHTDRTTHAPNEGSTLYYCSMASLQQPLDDSTIYDNHVPHWNGSRAATGNACDSAAVDSYQPSSESEDVLVYASLNHSSILDKLPRKEQDVEIEFTEYATVCVKK